MIDCKQSSIHLGATAIGSAVRASDVKKRQKHLSSREFSPRTLIKHSGSTHYFDMHTLRVENVLLELFSTENSSGRELFLPELYFKSMPDCKQSNIHLGATAIGSADRASDDEIWYKHLSSGELSPRTLFGNHSIKNFQTLFRVESFLLELSQNRIRCDNMSGCCAST